MCKYLNILKNEDLECIKTYLRLKDSSNDFDKFFSKKAYEEIKNKAILKFNGKCFHDRKIESMTVTRNPRSFISYTEDIGIEIPCKICNI